MVNVEQSPPAKLDGAGLVLLLPGCEIIAGTADTVKLRSQTGADQTPADTAAGFSFAELCPICRAV